LKEPVAGPACRLKKADSHFFDKQISRIVREMRRFDGNKAWLFTMLPGTIPRAFHDFRAGPAAAADAIANRASGARASRALAAGGRFVRRGMRWQPGGSQQSFSAIGIRFHPAIASRRNQYRRYDSDNNPGCPKRIFLPAAFCCHCPRAGTARRSVPAWRNPG
jgi:hypothetical protein